VTLAIHGGCGLVFLAQMQDYWQSRRYLDWAIEHYLPISVVDYEHPDLKPCSLCFQAQRPLAGFLGLQMVFRSE
jgi:hypothetical protein